MHSPFIGAYWSARRETKAECAARCATLLARLSSEAEFSQWFVKGRTLKKALALSLPSTPEGIEHLLMTNNRDTDRTPIVELGYDLDVWNGNLKQPASLSINCGVFSSLVYNNALLNLPILEELENFHLESFQKLLNVMVEVWDPDHAVATSLQLLAESNGAMPWECDSWFKYRKGA